MLFFHVFFSTCTASVLHVVCFGNASVLRVLRMFACQHLNLATSSVMNRRAWRVNGEKFHSPSLQKSMVQKGDTPNKYITG